MNVLHQGEAGMKQASYILIGIILSVCFSAGCSSVEGKRVTDTSNTVSNADKSDNALHGEFTGNMLLTIFVSDVERSAVFYRDVLGFNFLGYYDYDKRENVDSWESPEPPIYAGFKAGNRKFGLHKPMSEAQQLCLGKGRCYFEVNDLDKHYQRVLARRGQPSKISETSHLKKFYVKDPDGWYIYFAVAQKDAPTYPW